MAHKHSYPFTNKDPSTKEFLLSMQTHSGHLVVRLREQCGMEWSEYRQRGWARLRLKSPTWLSPLSSQALRLDQLSILCQSPYETHITFTILLNLNISVTSFDEDIFLSSLDDDFIILACFPMLFFKFSLQL